MRYRTLGRSGLRVSEIGFGGWGLGATMWRGVDDDESRRALHEALDLGVSFIDTALAYGDGHSERQIAKVLSERRGGDRPLIATKIPPKNDGWPGRASSPLFDVFPPAWVAECVEDSLRNLEVDALEIQQLHVWNDAWLDQPGWPALRETMERLRQEGKVLHWGISINDHAPHTALRLLRDPLIETAQVIYNIYDRSAEGPFFDTTREHDVGVIVRVPLDEGALAGAVSHDTVFPEGDWRSVYFAGERRAEAGRRAEGLRTLLGDEAETLPELALRFCLSRADVATVIPGMRRPEHARANAAVSDGRTLTPDLLHRLREHAWPKNWYEG